MLLFWIPKAVQKKRGKKKEKRSFSITEALSFVTAQDARAAKVATTFTVEAFVHSFPQLEGLLGPTASTIALANKLRVDDDGEEIFSPYYDSEAKCVVVSVAMPPNSTRALEEVMALVHHYALDRDSGEGTRCAADLIDILSRLATDQLVRFVQQGGAFSPVGLRKNLRSVCSALLCHPFAEDPTELEVERVTDSVFTVWELLQPAAAILSGWGGSQHASALSSSATVNIELLRWRLLRSAVDGRLPQCICDTVKSFAKRLKRIHSSLTLQRSQESTADVAHSSQDEAWENTFGAFVSHDTLKAQRHAMEGILEEANRHAELQSALPNEDEVSSSTQPPSVFKFLECQQQGDATTGPHTTEGGRLSPLTLSWLLQWDSILADYERLKSGCL